MKYSLYISVVLMVLLCGCSVKRNNFFSRHNHQLTIRYNVYFNGNHAYLQNVPLNDDTQQIANFALELRTPENFRKVEDVLITVDQLYAQAYSRYQQLYYNKATQICDDILQKYPDNKLKSNILFLKALCVLNTRPPEGQEA